ncbi:MAG: vanadium-dependent haloperoxidase [Steroidobacteraceae bacterium]
MEQPRTRFSPQVLLAMLACAPWAPAHAVDAASWWNRQAGDIVAAAQLSTPAANRVMAIASTAAYEAANAVTGRYARALTQLQREPAVSVEAAIAAAHRASLLALLPGQQPAIDGAYRDALAPITDDAARSAGVALGERAARIVLEQRTADGASAVAEYRPATSPGRYVPTALPIATQWPARRPWFMTSGAQFRPAPPPSLASEFWAHDYAEILRLGRRDGSTRSDEQTAAALFWEATQPRIYHELVRIVADQPGRDVVQNARLFALVAEALDDALIAVFDAKYHYAFWRPITAIRNGDVDGNAATLRDAGWLPLIDTPLHPEYPCAHCIAAATVATILQAEIGSGPEPAWTSHGGIAADRQRSWPTLEAFVRDVAEARIAAGVHFRNSTAVGTRMGREVGTLALERFR